MNTAVNYLIAFDRKKLQYKSIEKIISLFGLLEGVTIVGEQISFMGSEFQFAFTEEKIAFEQGQDLMILDLIVCSHSNEKDIEVLAKLLREIRTVIKNNNGTVTSILDGISAFYAEKAYPFIHRIENRLRQLYAKFTVYSLGPDWVNSIPENVSNGKKNKNDDSNPLYDLDFIHIKEILFQEYANKEAGAEFFVDLQKNQVAPEDIKDYVPQSNWQRYIKSAIDCDQEFLQTRWEKLYKLRNKIAHNRDFNREDFVNVKKLTKEIEEKLKPGMSKMASIQPIPAPAKSSVQRNNFVAPRPVKQQVQSSSPGDLLGPLLLGAVFGSFLSKS